MSEPQPRRVDRILDPAYLGDLDTRSLDELHGMHEECFEVETETSYVRRLAQARIDILEAELERRAAGGTVGDLVAALPRILADEGPRGAPASSRLPRHLGPAPAVEFARGMEYLISDATLANLPTIPDDELRETLSQLRELEREVSDRRRALHRAIDRIELAVADRHKVGHA